MELTMFAGSANRMLAEAIAHSLGIPLGKCRVERFPDGEIHVELQQSVRGHDIYLVQPTSPPVEGHLLELLLLADACRRAGAERLTAVIPYFGYARQDRRASGREAVGGRLVADLISAAGLDRIVAVDLHTSALEGFFTVPLEHLSAVPVLANAIQLRISTNSVVVAPDLGAAKLAERYGSLLGCSTAIVHKTRISGLDVSVREVVGEVRDRVPLIVDDMISTAGTIEAAAKSLLEAGCVPQIDVVASHSLLVGPAVQRLETLPIRLLITTDSVASAPASSLPIERVSLGPLLGGAIDRLHRQTSLGDLFVSGG